MTGAPVLVCVGPDRRAASAIAAHAAAVLTGRDAVVLSAWAPPRLPFSPFVAAWETIFEPPEEVAAAARLAAKEAAHAACDALRAAGWSAEPRVVRDDRAPWRVALDTASAIDATAIVAGAHETVDVLPGSLGREARALAHHCARPLLVVPPTGDEPDDDAPALLAYDGSRSAGNALDAAVRLLVPRPAIVATAWEPNTTITPVAFVGAGGLAAAGRDPHSHDLRISAGADETARAGEAILEQAGWPVFTRKVIRTSRGTWRALVDLAVVQEAAVVVVGTRGHAPVVSALIGSVAEGVLRHAGRAVLLVPPAAA